MSNLTNYFRQKSSRTRFHLGDRVFGHWNRIPFIGSVALETPAYPEQAAQVKVFLDLPIRYHGSNHTVIAVHPKTLKPLVKF